jgi:hypothetical protein
LVEVSAQFAKGHCVFGEQTLRYRRGVVGGGISQDGRALPRRMSSPALQVLDERRRPKEPSKRAVALVKALYFAKCLVSGKFADDVE